VHKVLRFAEKPPLEKAKAFLHSGDYLWNAGIFIWRASAVVNALNHFVPHVIQPLADGVGLWNTDKETQFVESVFPGLENVSIDYAIMEKASNVYTIPASFGWSDLGTWASLHAESAKDEHDNVVQTQFALLYDTQNCMVRVPKDKMVVIRGLEDFIVVDEGDILMIFPKSMEQDIKGVARDAGILGGNRFI
jgi:mannose-1-phosphate guanylyltransferase